MQTELGSTITVGCSQSEILEYKLGGDNVDSNIYPSFQHVDMGTQSLRYFHAYAVKDRIDLSHLSNEHQHQIETKKYDHDLFFPTSTDRQQLISDAEILISR